MHSLGACNVNVKLKYQQINRSLVCIYVFLLPAERDPALTSHTLLLYIVLGLVGTVTVVVVIVLGRAERFVYFMLLGFYRPAIELST